MAEESEIRKFYAGRKILITGVSGFIGKVLLWKLLHDCPSIDKIYVLIRPKRGVPTQSRIDNILTLSIYDSIRQIDEKLLQKVVAVGGDVTEDNLNLSSTDRKMLTDQVSVVFHIAAALNMEADLKTAVNMNTVGALRIIELCSEMKNLELFIHTSTAYCYCDRDSTEEIVYPPNEDPADVIHLTEWMPKDLLEKLTPDLIKPHPNTYTYTKRLAEKIVADHYPKLPIVIARPSIVVPSLKEPVPGWVDNMNGPVGLFIAAGKGVLRSMLVDEQAIANLIAVDVVANSLIAIGWKMAGELKKHKPERIPVMNITMSDTYPIRWHDMVDLGLEAIQKYPFQQILWYPGGRMTSNKFYHEFVTITCQWIPAYLLDFLLLVFAQKPFLVEIQKKVAHGQRVLMYFTTRSWTFATDNMLALKEQMNLTDREIFPVTMEGYTKRLENLQDAILVAKRVILKENVDSSNLKQCRKKLTIYYGLDCFVRFLAILFLIWFVMQQIVKIGTSLSDE